jgi:hypothetical protein
MLNPSPCSPDIFTRLASMPRSILSNSDRGHQQGAERSPEKGMAYLPSPGWYVFTIRLQSFQGGGFSFGGCQSWLTSNLKGMTHTKSWKTTWPNTT